MQSISKIGDAHAASTYYSETDDYYRAEARDKSAWIGTRAGALGLRGSVDKSTFENMLRGRFGDEQIGHPGTRTARGKDGNPREVPAHTPGWDVTFSAPKSVSIAGLVHGDDRIAGAVHDAARDAILQTERDMAVTRQRGPRGKYEHHRGDGIAAAMFAHVTSRSRDPQLHEHVVILNGTLDPVSGRSVSLDSREGIYRLHGRQESIFMHGLASRLRDMGYDIDWHIDDAGHPSFELAGISQAEIDGFSGRKAEIDAELAAHGTDRAHASRAARQAATLDTRSPKEPASASELQQEWSDRARALGVDLDRIAAPEGREHGDHSDDADAAVASAMASQSERQSRFVGHDLMQEARRFSAGRASEQELRDAVTRAIARGDLIPSQTRGRMLGGVVGNVHGYTTAEGQQTERAMLDDARRLRDRGTPIAPASDAKAAVTAADAASSGRMLEGQRRAMLGLLTDGSDVQILQGYAGSAKTTGVLRGFAAEARRHGYDVHAAAPTASAARTLGDALGVPSKTVAGMLSQRGRASRGRDLYIVDEAGMIGAVDMQRLLERADVEHAKVVLVGDTAQIGSVPAGAALGQLEDELPGDTRRLDEIVRQRDPRLREAIAAAARGDVDAAMSGISVHEHPLPSPAGDGRRPPRAKQREAADSERDAAMVGDVVDRYMSSDDAGRDVLAIGLSHADRDAINREVQRRRVERGLVSNVRETQTLHTKRWSAAQAGDAARYSPGDVIQSLRDTRHLGKGGLADVIGVVGGRVQVRTRGTGQTWSFDPSRYKSHLTLDAQQTLIGVGDRVQMRGRTWGRDDDWAWHAYANGDAVEVTGRGPDGALRVAGKDGHEYTLDTVSGVQADLGYASTADAAQGRTVDDVVVLMRSGQARLATQQRFYVGASRARDRIDIVTDNTARLADRLKRSTGEKETALDRDAQPAQGPDRGRNDAFLPGGANRTPREIGEGTTSLHDIASGVGRLTKGAALAAGRGVRDALARASREPRVASLSREQAVTAAGLALESGPRQPSRDEYRKMARRHGVARGPDGTRYTMDDGGHVYSDRMARAARREAARSEWADPRKKDHYRIADDGRVLASHDHGASWHRAGVIDSIRGHYDDWSRSRVQERLERGRLAWQTRGMQETHDSAELARAALDTQAKHDRALFRRGVDWDRLAAKHGVAYDREGHRYAYDGRGGVWSEGLAKRAEAARSRAARDAMQDLHSHGRRGYELARGRDRHGKRRHHLAGRMYHGLAGRAARTRLERAIGDGQQREKARLARLALGSHDKEWRDRGRHETRNSRGLAREALAGHADRSRTGRKFDWDAAALARGVEYDRHGGRYARDDKGRARSEALEKSSYQIGRDRDARQADRERALGPSRGPRARANERRVREAVAHGKERERERLEQMAGYERGQTREAEPERTQEPTRPPEPTLKRGRSAELGPAREPVAEAERSR